MAIKKIRFILSVLYIFTNVTNSFQPFIAHVKLIILASITNTRFKMKILKYLFLLLLIVLVGGAIYFGTKDGNFDVAKSKVINAPAEVVYDNVKDYKNWAIWGPWMNQDENIEIFYTEKTEGEGASYSWKSEEIGDGSMQTVGVIPNKEIDQKITFNTPVGDSESDVYWRFEPSEEPGKTKVTWGMKGEQSFMEKVFMAFQPEDFETSLGNMYEKGLANLEMEINKSMNQYTVTVDGVTQHGGGFYLYTTTSSKLSEIGAKMRPMMRQLSGYMEQNNINMSGMPFTIYNELDNKNGTAIFSAAIPVSAKVITLPDSSVLCNYMGPVSALKTTLKGKYEYLVEAYTKSKEYMQKNNLVADPARKMFEVYIINPGTTSNPSNWITEIYIPVLNPKAASFN